MAWILAGALLLAVVGGGFFLLSRSRSPSMQAQLSHGPFEPLPRVKVLRLDVMYHVRNEKGDVPQGRLGVEDGWFHTRLNDSVTVAGKLSEPAYCYLIAYLPNGKEDLCFPEDEAEAPPRTDEPRYPSRTANHYYGLEEGAGLMAFVLVVSRQPLPAYRDWRGPRGASPWRATSALPDVVWRGDGLELRPVTPNDPDARGKRPGETGLGPLRELLAWLRRDERFETIATVAFPVVARP
jgi:hypothetical protein